MPLPIGQLLNAILHNKFLPRSVVKIAQNRLSVYDNRKVNVTLSKLANTYRGCNRNW